MSLQQLASHANSEKLHFELEFRISFTIFSLLYISTPAPAGFWGGLDIDEMSDIQEKAFQAARACDRGEYLDACDDFISYLPKTAELLDKHFDEIEEGIKDGDSSYIRILERQQRLMKRAKQVR